MTRPSRFVGRTTELASLRRALMTDGATEVCTVVTGEAGVGKTRILHEAIRPLGEGGAVVVAGECIASGTDLIPLAPILEGLRHLAASTPSPATRERLLALTRGRTDSEPGADGSVSPAATVLDALTQVAGSRLSVLVIDDLQWADRATLALIEHIVRNLPGSGVRVLVALRLDGNTPRAVVRLTAELARHRRVRFVYLKPLGDRAVREMVRVAWGADIADDVIRRIVARSGGLPFYIESILAQGDRSAQALPDDLRIVTMTQIDSLPADARRMLEALAVLTEPIDRRLLAQVANVHDSPRSALDRLASAYLALDDLGRWSVRHSIIREVICAHLSEAEKRALHAAAAAAIRTAAPTEESRRAEFLALAAFHATAAGAEREAVLDHLEAARAALELGQTELAHRQAELALGQARARPEILERSGWDLAQVEDLAARALSTARPPSSAAASPGLTLADRRPDDSRDSAAVERVLVGLTSREREVAELIARGASNRDIASELVITEKTASIHVSNIIGKLGVRRRGEVAALIHQSRQGRA